MGDGNGNGAITNIAQDYILDGDGLTLKYGNSDPNKISFEDSVGTRGGEIHLWEGGQSTNPALDIHAQNGYELDLYSPKDIWIRTLDKAYITASDGINFDHGLGNRLHVGDSTNTNGISLWDNYTPPGTTNYKGPALEFGGPHAGKLSSGDVEQGHAVLYIHEVGSDDFNLRAAWHKPSGNFKDVFVAG